MDARSTRLEKISLNPLIWLTIWYKYIKAYIKKQYIAEFLHKRTKRSRDFTFEDSDLDSPTKRVKI